MFRRPVPPLLDQTPDLMPGVADGRCGLRAAHESGALKTRVALWAAFGLQRRIRMIGDWTSNVCDAALDDPLIRNRCPTSP